MKQALIIIAIVAIAILAWLGINNKKEVEPNLNIPGDSTALNINMEHSTATFTTNYGVIILELFDTQAPITTGNFIKLAKEGFYSGTKFHRVIEGFMIQGGDPLTKNDQQAALWGTGGPGYAIEDEFAPGISNVRGTISMANAGPNTGGSQFFINQADNTFLDGKHAVFGQVLTGMDVVDAIAKVQTNAADRPIQPVIIESITISDAPAA